MRALVLLHGWAMSPRVFDTLAEHLRASFTVHAVALPGYCGEPSIAPYSLTALAARISDAAPERCVVAGWSLGGQVALAWAAARPRQVEALALIGATPSFVQRDGWPHAVEASVFDAFAVSLERDRDATLTRFASLQSQGDASMKATAQRVRASLCAEGEASTASLRASLDVLLDTDLRGVLGAIDHETLLIHGERDRLVPFAAAEHVARAMKRARLRPIEGAAHAPFVSRPEAAAAALRELAA